MKVIDKRPKDMGHLFVVGGPGGSGSSTIAKMLTREFGLHYVYGGQYMRNISKNLGYESIEEFLKSLKSERQRYVYDKAVDKRMIRMSYYPDVLVDSKIFSALATNYKIPTTVKIWLDASIYARVRRTLHKKKILDLSEPLSKSDPLYIDTRDKLMKRFSNDKNRYRRLYAIDYNQPKKYNDIVLDTSNLDAKQTLNLVIKRIKDGKYTE
jgi:cytidylate kinase